MSVERVERPGSRPEWVRTISIWRFPAVIDKAVVEFTKDA